MGQRVEDYFADAVGRVAGFLPNLLSAIIILVVGYLLSRLAGTLVRSLLARAGFDRFVARRFTQRRVVVTETPEVEATVGKRTPSSLVGSLTFWLGLLVTLSMASRSLGLTSLSSGLDRILGFIPHVLVAAIIVAAAAAVGDLLANLIGDLAHGWLAKASRTAVMVLAVFMALDELGIATRVVVITFSVLLGAAAVAASIAFGIGNIPLARDYTRRWLERAEEEKPRPEPSEPLTH